MLFSTYRAEALSTTTIGSQDVTVGTGVITIEPGAERLYIIVATFRPTIWRLAGAMERVERLVLSSNNTRASGSSAMETPLMGVTGIASDRVTS